MVQCANLIIRHAAIIEIAIELRSVEAKRQATGSRMADDAFVARRVMPGLRAHDAAIVDDEIFVCPSVVDQCRIGSRAAPPISDAINSSGIFDEEPRFDAAV